MKDEARGRPPRRASPQPVAEDRAPADPRVSVVVTCYNYGHFLEDCLESLLAQSSPPAEIVAVDDGSTDATGRILAAYAGRVIGIRTSNRGQAAAFNTGFAATSGDVVLFLDADDRLRPEALETLLHHWCDDFAVLSFGLETIDEAGRSTGVHTASVAADGGDNRPRLLATGTFAFPPTSGNAFARPFLEVALPMPEARWRISADCYLIRAAALFGRFGHVPRVLGSYRLHNGNNYARGAEPDLTQHAANQRDNADALLALAERATDFAAGAGEAAALAAALRHRAAALVADRRPRPARATGARTPAAAPPPRGGRRAAEARARPGLPRWPVHLPTARWVDPREPGPYRDIVVPGAGAWPTAPRAAATLVFAVDPAPGPYVATLALAISRAGEDDRREAAIAVDGATIWRGPARPWQLVHLPIRRGPWQAQDPVCIEIDVLTGAVAGAADDRIAVEVTGLQVRLGGGEPAAPFLEAGSMAPPATALGAGLDPATWEGDADGGATLREASGWLRFTAPAAEACDLLLDFGRPPAGWLTVRRHHARIFTGRLGPTRRLALRLPATSATARHDLSLHFEPSGAADAPLRIAALGLRVHAGVDLDGHCPPPATTLNLGQTVAFGAEESAGGFLADGWRSEGGEVRGVAPEAEIAFRLPEDADAAILAVALAPVLEPGPGTRHVVGVSRGGQLAATLELRGPGTIDLPLADALTGREVRLGFHSVFVSASGEGASPAPLALHSISLAGSEGPAPARSAPAAPPPAPRGIHSVLAAAAALLDPGADPEVAACAGLRAELTAYISETDAAAFATIASTPHRLELLVRIGAAARHEAPTAAEARALRRASKLAAKDDRNRTRAALIALLHLPAYAAPIAPDLDRLPPPLLWAPAAMARYFGSPPELDDGEAHRRYRGYLERLLAGIDRILAREAEESARFRLAAATLGRLRSTVAIFGTGALRDLIRLRSRCIERLLARRGARLAAPRPPRRGADRLRLGVLVRDVLPNPEGWALIGMYEGLDRERFETVLVRMDRSSQALDPGDRFAEELCLSELSIEESVAGIRALDLDLLLTGAYAAEWEKTTAILAHRLARVQVWAGAVCPTTGGFRSFDVALTCRATEPEAPERHYVEPLAWIDGPLQAAYAFPATGTAHAADLRRAIGLADDAVMLASGAMAHKIGDALLAAWADILAGASRAVLVLYPFAPNWSMAFAFDRFRARLDRHLAAAGVGAERAVLLWTQPPERARAIAAAADLYLDSFPYTGATTVCEALAGGTPVLTLTGDGLRERTGTSWVRAFGLPELAVASPEEYVATGRKLCTDPEALAALRARLVARRAGGPPHHDPAGFGAAFSDALWRVARDSGRFPELGDRPPPAAALTPADVAPRLQAAALPARSATATVRLIVLASPRTGSTLFCDLLNRTPGVVCHYELFHADMIQYVDRTVTDPEALRDRDADPVGFFRRIFAEAERRGHSLVGFKHFADVNYAVTEAAIADPAIKIVHIGRRNLLAQFSSEQIARADGQWFGREGSRRERARVPFDPAHFERWEAYQRRMERERLDLFAAHGRDVLFLGYTTILDPDTPARLSRFLGVDIACAGASGFQRQNPPVILDRFTNPEEVSAYLARRDLAHWAEHG